MRRLNNSDPLLFTLGTEDDKDCTQHRGRHRKVILWTCRSESSVAAIRFVTDAATTRTLDLKDCRGTKKPSTGLRSSQLLWNRQHVRCTFLEVNGLSHFVWRFSIVTTPCSGRRFRHKIGIWERCAWTSSPSIEAAFLQDAR